MQGGKRERGKRRREKIYEFAVTAMALAYSLRFFRLRTTVNGKREMLKRSIRVIDVTLTEMFIPRSKRISDIVRLRRVSSLVLLTSASIAARLSALTNTFISTGKRDIIDDYCRS